TRSRFTADVHFAESKILVTHHGSPFYDINLTSTRDYIVDQLCVMRKTADIVFRRTAAAAIYRSTLNFSFPSMWSTDHRHVTLTTARWQLCAVRKARRPTATYRTAAFYRTCVRRYY